MQLIVIQNHSLQLLSNQIYINIKMWRRERDSNPRNGFPFTRFPSVRLQPSVLESLSGLKYYLKIFKKII